MGEVLCSTENSPFLIIDHIHAKINRVCCAALAIGKRCMNVRKNKLLLNETRHEKTNILRTQKQRRRLASRQQRLCFRYIDSTSPILSKSEISNLKPSSVAVQNIGFLMTTRLINLS